MKKDKISVKTILDSITGLAAVCVVVAVICIITLLVDLVTFNFEAMATPAVILVVALIVGFVNWTKKLSENKTEPINFNYAEISENDYGDDYENDTDKKPHISVSISKDPVYSYSNVKVAFSENCEMSLLYVGQTVFFIDEVDNENDSAAMAVYVSADKKLGYMYKGKLRDMIRDFEGRGETVEAFISKMSSNGIELQLNFYK